jgi:hypothetical protein
MVMGEASHSSQKKMLVLCQHKTEDAAFVALPPHRITSMVSPAGHV